MQQKVSAALVSTRMRALLILVSAAIIASGIFFAQRVLASTAGDVVINEFVSSPSSGDEWIELYNTTSSSIDLSDWTLKDGAATPHIISLSGSIAAKGFAVFEYAVPELNNAGDTITLLDNTSATIDSVAYGTATGKVVAAPAVGQSAYRTTDGGTSWALTDSPTEGLTNVVPAASVSAEDFGTWDNSQAFKGINVGFKTANFTSVSSIKVDLYSGSTLVAENTGSTALINDINTQHDGFGQNGQLSSPFVISGALNDTWCAGGPCWNAGAYTWTPRTVPTKAVIIVTGADANGNSTQTAENDTFSQTGGSFASFFPLPACSTTDTVADTTFDTFDNGSVNGQNGWMSTGHYDQSIVDNTTGFSSFGCKSLRISNAYISGSFGDQTFAASTTAPAGEAVTNNHYVAQFDITTAELDEQPGLALSVSPDDGKGSRMSYLSFTDTSSGIDVGFYDVQGTTNPANFVSTDLGTISRTSPHTIKFDITFVPGPGNDIVKIYIDGVLVHTGTTWENYYRYDSEQAGNGNQLFPISTLIFHAGGTAAPSTLGEGFLFDNVELATDVVAGPPVVITDPATNITTSDATLNGTVGPADASGYLFWVSTSTIDTSNPNVLPPGAVRTAVLGTASANTAFSSLLSSLTTAGMPHNMLPITPGTTYYYVAWADVGGTWHPGAMQSFTTNPAAPALKTPSSGTTFETNNFDFTWDPVTSDAGPVTYQFHSSLNPAVTDGVLTTGLWTSGTLTSPMIHSSGASDGTWYWQVRAQDINGTWSPWSSIWNMTIDTAAVTTNDADPVHNTDATLNGTNGPTAADNTSFWWGTSSAGPFTSSSNPGSEFPAGWKHDSGLGAAAAGAQFNESLTGLTTGMTYYFVAWSHIGGTWQPGAVKTFVTGGVAPTASATTNAANPVENTSATLNGTNGDIAADNTSFWWGTTNAGPFASSSNPSSEFPAGWSHDSGLAASPANGSFSESLTGLATTTTYYFTAWSHVGGVWYPGAVLSFKTLLDSPIITSPTDGTATTSAALQQVAWTSVGGTGVTYVYQSSTSDATNSDGSFTNPAYTSGPLSTTYISTAGTPAGTYYLHVMAKDSEGNTSPWSSIVEVKVVASAASLQGTLVLVKHTTSSDGSFDIGVASNSYTATTTFTTLGGAATSSAIALDPGTYNLTEDAQNNWILKSVSCDAGSPSSITNGESITINTGVTVTCTFIDEPATKLTEAIYLGDLATSTTDVVTNPNKWFAYNDTTDQIDSTLGAFVNGPIPAPLGNGSIQFTVGTTPLDRQNIATYQFAGLPLSEITALSYSAYSHSGVGSDHESPFFNFNVDFDGSNTWQGRLVYVPSANSSVPQNAWNTFDMINSGNAKWTYSHFASNGKKWPDGNPNEYRTWSDIMAHFPNAKILASDGWLGVRVGEPGPTGYVGNVDNFRMTVDSGSQSSTVVADFEPDTGTETAISGVSPEPSTVGDPYTVSWKVTADSGATPKGTVTVTVNGGSGCSANVSVGSCQITPISDGSVELVAKFTGDAGFDDSASASATHVINVAATPNNNSNSGSGGGPIAGSTIGDINRDGRVDFLDFALLMAATGTSNAAADLNNDGTVNLADLAILFAHWTI